MYLGQQDIFGIIMKDYRYKIEKAERHERVGKQTTVKQAERSLNDHWKWVAEKFGVPEDVLKMGGKLEYAVCKAAIDADKNGGRGGMTQAADCVRDTRNEAKQLREKYDQKYM